MIGENIPVPMPSADKDDLENEEDSIEIVKSGKMNASTLDQSNTNKNLTPEVQILSDGEDEPLSVTNNMQMP